MARTVLFSNDSISQYVNDHFEPAWETVRAVPMVHIDFGNGNVLTRTLNGNVATYLCTSEGNVLDILPGIYQPETYLAQLEDLIRLSRFVHQDKYNVYSASQYYHRQQAAALSAGKPREVFVEKEFNRVSIIRIERGVKLVLEPSNRLAVRSGRVSRQSKNGKAINLSSAEDLAAWKALADDTRLNETVRRQQIHSYLTKQEKFIQPSDITKWLYREVLHADLDDPYLGLGKVLFATYPFAAEDAQQ